MRPDEQTSLPVDRPDHGMKSQPGGVGRLIDPDQGGLRDSEAQAVAMDTGELSGLSAEEAAMHLEPSDDEELAEDERDDGDDDA